MRRRLIAALATLFLFAAAAPLMAGLADTTDDEAKKMLQEADRLYILQKQDQAVQMYRQLIREHADSKYRHTAQLRIGQHLFKQGDFKGAVGSFHKVAQESEDEKEAAEGMLMKGRCFFEQQEYDKAFTTMRDLAEKYPGTSYSNQASYYIGLAHMRLNNFNQAIEAFLMVGTSVDMQDPHVRTIAPGRRLFIKVNDDDLRVVARQKKTIKVQVKSTSGDAEECELAPIGALGREFVGWILTELGKANPGDSKLQIQGDDKVEVSYADSHTAAGEVNATRLRELSVAHDGNVSFTDGAFESKVPGVALGARANVRVVDYDRSVSEERNRVTVTIRSESKVDDADVDIEKAGGKVSLDDIVAGDKEDKYEKRDEVTLTLDEREVPQVGYHSGIFVGVVELRDEEPDAKDDILQAKKDDRLVVVYADQKGLLHKAGQELTDTAKVVEGRLNPLQPFESDINDASLRVRRELGVAKTLLDMGRIYNDLGLQDRAHLRLDEALEECRKVAQTNAANDPKLLEQCQFLTWKIYFEKGDLNSAVRVCMSLIKMFPDSEYVDDALLTMGNSELDRGDYNRAISVFRSLARVEDSVYRPDAVFKIAECYEKMAVGDGKRGPNTAMEDRALEQYETVLKSFPDSKFAAQSVVKIADYYYRNKQYDRAIEVYERAMRDYPDSKQMAIILLNYGKAMVRSGNLAGAMQKFQAVVTSYPESDRAEEARMLLQATRRRLSDTGGAGGGFE